MTDFENDAAVLESFPDRPIPLIQLIEDSGTCSMVMNVEAVDMLSRIRGKVCPIAVAGLYRTGKSSLMNWVLDRPAGFTVGPTVQRCTRGIWIWGTSSTVMLRDRHHTWGGGGGGGLVVGGTYRRAVRDFVFVLG